MEHHAHTQCGCKQAHALCEKWGTCQSEVPHARSKRTHSWTRTHMGTHQHPDCNPNYTTTHFIPCTTRHPRAPCHDHTHTHTHTNLYTHTHTPSTHTHTHTRMCTHPNTRGPPSPPEKLDMPCCFNSSTEGSNAAWRSCCSSPAAAPPVTNGADPSHAIHCDAASARTSRTGRMVMSTGVAKVLPSSKDSVSVAVARVGSAQEQFSAGMATHPHSRLVTCGSHCAVMERTNTPRPQSERNVSTLHHSSQHERKKRCGKHPHAHGRCVTAGAEGGGGHSTVGATQT